MSKALEFNWQVTVSVDERTTKSQIVIDMSIGNMICRSALDPKTAKEFGNAVIEASERAGAPVLIPSAQEKAKFS